MNSVKIIPRLLRRPDLSFDVFLMIQRIIPPAFSNGGDCLSRVGLREWPEVVLEIRRMM